MKVFESSWRTFAVRAAVLGGVVFGAVRFAVARPGVAGGPAGSFVTVAGTLTGVSGATMATFEFRRTGTTMVLCAPQVTITPGAGGAFSVPVPLDQPELSAMARCPDDLFDGRDVQVRVLIGGNEVATWAPINPVPYAHFASSAGRASGQLEERLQYEVQGAAAVALCAVGGNNLPRAVNMREGENGNDACRRYTPTARTCAATLWLYPSSAVPGDSSEADRGDCTRAAPPSIRPYRRWACCN